MNIKTFLFLFLKYLIDNYYKKKVSFGKSELKGQG